MDKDISKLLTEIKAKTGWSEPKIAAAISTSQPTVNRILHGQTECKLSTLRAITLVHEQQCGTAKPQRGRRRIKPGPAGENDIHREPLR